MSPSAALPRAEIVVDLGAIRRNVARLRTLVAPAEVMVVVKADAYGHGMVPVAAAVREEGVAWLGVATLDEAVALRVAGDTGRVLCWLAVPGEDYLPAIAHDVDVTASSVAQVDAIAEAARAADRTARLQLKFDTGLSRGGAERAAWETVIAAAAKAQASGAVTVTGLWSHFACSDEPEHPANDVQERAFREAVRLAEAAGLDPEVRHLANSAGALLRPSARFDLVRLGIASYGLSPAPDVVSTAELGLRPAMTVRGRIALAKDIPAGAGVSYGHTFIAPELMHVALVPMGYGDGIPRHASGSAEVQVRGRRAQLLGRVCMDQVVVAASDAEPGDPVVLFGPGDDGEPTALDWARWCDTIDYEILTRMGGRQQRTWVG